MPEHFKTEAGGTASADAKSESPMTADEELAALRKRVQALEAREAERLLAEQHLAESEARFEALFSGLNVGVVVQGPRTEILLINARACELLGVSEEQIRGKSSFDPRWNIIRENGENFPAEERPVAQVLKSGQAVRDVIIGVFRPGPGDRAWLLVTAVPQFDSMGNIVQIVATFTDISELKRIETQVRAQQRTIAALSTPLVPLAPGIVLMSLVGAMEPWRMRQAMEVLLRGIAETRARAALVDVAGILEMDQQIAEGMIRLANTSKWLGATVIFTGIRPDMAKMLSYSKEDLSSIVTRGTLQAGFLYAQGIARSPS